MPDATTDPGKLFGALVERFGLGTALSLLRLLDPSGSTISKAFAGARLGGTGLRVAGGLGGYPGLATLGKNVGTALGLAGTGYDVYQTATNPRLSTAQKGGHAALSLADLLTSLYVAPPFGALGVAGKALNQALARSSSPQISGAAKGASSPALPVEALLDVLGGDRSPKGAIKHAARRFGENPFRSVVGTLDPVSGAIFGALGIGEHKPTEGTQFRKGLQQGLSGTGLKLDYSKYNAPAGGYESFDPKHVAAAKELGTLLTAGRKNKPEAYGLQAANIFLQSLPGPQIQSILDYYRQRLAA
jgi:hypothetical protein